MRYDAVLLFFVLFPAASMPDQRRTNTKLQPDDTAQPSTENGVLGFHQAIPVTISTNGTPREQTFFRTFGELARTYSEKRIAIVGGGVAGLYFAIQVRKHLGANVDIFEKRNTFSRQNIVILYDPTIEELEKIGAFDILEKTPYTYDEVSSTKTMPIGTLQHVLLRIALMYGVVMSPNSEYNKTADFSTYDAVYDATGKARVFRNFEIDTERESSDAKERVCMTFIADNAKKLTSTQEVTAVGTYDGSKLQVSGPLFPSLHDNYLYYVGLLEVDGNADFTPGKAAIEKKVLQTNIKYLAQSILQNVSGPAGNVTSTVSSTSVFLLDVSPEDPIQPAVVRNRKLFGLLGDALITPDWTKASGVNHAFFSGRLHVRLLRLYFKASEASSPDAQEKKIEEMINIGKSVLPEIRMSVHHSFPAESSLTGESTKES